MTAAAPARRSWLVRLLLTPVGPRLLIPWRPLPEPLPRPRELIAAAALPASVADLVWRVVRRTRLWRRERVDLARELCSHFGEGLAAGRTAERLIADFGDPRAAARLIRRAKKRSRPLLYKAWLRGWQSLGLLVLLCLALYAVLALRYFTGRPIITRNYAAELNAQRASIAAADRAWPLYQRAGAALPVMSAELRQNWGSVRPGDDVWPEAGAYLASAQQAISLTRDASLRPSLGMEIAEPGAHEMLLVTFEARYGHLSSLQHLSRLLREDALRAAAAGDRAAVLSDLEAQFRMAAHAGEAPFLFNDSLRFSITGSAFRTIGELLAGGPALFADHDLADLAHRLAALNGGGPFTINTDGDVAAFRDAVQRLFTDDGRGDGRLAPAGQEQMQSLFARWSPGDSSRAELLVGPLLSAAIPGRRETLRRFDLLKDQALAESSKPLYARTEEPDSLDLDVETGTLRSVAQAMVNISGTLPAFGQMSIAAERLTQRRDATLVAIAIELYRRAHGGYPATLSELTPSLLPAVPIDRFDGLPLKYRLTDGDPLLYSVGANMTDEGGMPPPPGRDPSRWIPPARVRFLHANARYATNIALGGDWILWPEPRDR